MALRLSGLVYISHQFNDQINISSSIFIIAYFQLALFLFTG